MSAEAQAAGDPLADAEGAALAVGQLSALLNVPDEARSPAGDPLGSRRIPLGPQQAQWFPNFPNNFFNFPNCFNGNWRNC